MEKNKKVRNDIILTAVILASALLVFLVFILTMRDGAYAVVTEDGSEIGRYSLSEDVTVNLGDGVNSFNILVIRNGEALISDASCPDGICKEHRPIKYEGESIVCLPNKIVVTIVGENEDSDVDVVS